MGLDNGITVSRINRLSNSEPVYRKIFIFGRQTAAKYEFDFYTKELLEGDTVAYWRKCWNVRDSILNILNPEHDNDRFIFNISYKDLLHIIKALKSFNKHNWETGIWEWKDIKPQMRKCIKNLQILAEHMRKNPNVLHLEFYDSY